MAETTRVNPTDIMAVRSRVSWAAIAAGAMIALALYFVLSLMGIAVGLEIALRRDVGIGVGAALWSIFTLLFSMFVGGWATSRLAVGESKLEAVLYGVILWGVLFVGMFWLIGAGVRVGFAALMGLASGALPVVVEDVRPAETTDLVNTLYQRYNSELGSQKFADDLKKLGVDDQQASKIEALVKDKLEEVRKSPTPLPEQARRLASDPEVQQAAALALQRTRQATWYSLFGVLISMVTVIAGSLVGSGDLPVPLTIMGVRRVPTPRPQA